MFALRKRAQVIGTNPGKTGDFSFREHFLAGPNGYAHDVPLLQHKRRPVAGSNSQQ
jgi:hypothetical protein